MRRTRVTCYLVALMLFLCNNGRAQTAGMLYGLTYGGGSSSIGTLFSFDPLTGKEIPINEVIGINPWGGTMQASNQLLYGMTIRGGGSNNAGILFNYNIQAGKDSLLLYFDDATYGTNGADPWGNVVQASNGLFYGLTLAGGNNNLGTLFSYDIKTGILNTLINFGNADTGASPYGSLVECPKGVLYGVANSGCQYGDGGIFSYNTNTGAFKVVNSFNGTNGNDMIGSLMLARDSLLYGMTYDGGSSHDGVMFSFNPKKDTEIVLINFSGTDGQNPFGGLLQANNGIIYGLNSGGGANNEGVLFSYNPMNGHDTVPGKDTVLVNFIDSLGINPYGALIQADDGMLYGMTKFGGTGNSGVIFKYNIAAYKDSVMHNFTGIDGENPSGDLMEAMTATLTYQNVKCYGDSSGMAVISVRGGHYPLTYSWSNGTTTDTVKDLTAGTYTAQVVDQKGIAYDFSFIITQPPQLKDSLTAVNELCNGNSNGSANIAMQGGVKPYSYLWSSSLGTKPLVQNLTAGSYTCTVTDSNGCVNPIVVTITQPVLLKDTTLLVQNLVCNSTHNGEIKTIGMGGTPPYTYSWSLGGSTVNSITGLAAGTYTCTITDSNKCIGQNIATVTSPAPITPSSSFTATPCTQNHGTATVSPSGGTPPYAYSWSSGGETNASDTGLVAGPYTCTITDSLGCSYAALVIVPNSNGPKDSTRSTLNVKCYGDSTGKATVFATGGTPPYTYGWSPYGGTDTSATELVAGNYISTVTDNSGCIGVALITIAQPQPFKDSVVQTTNVSCFGGNNGSTQVGIMGGTTPYTFSWSSGTSTGAYDSLLITGTYTCAIEDKNNCIAPSVVISITSPTAINVDTVAKLTQCGKYNGMAGVIVSGGVGPYSYSWSPGGQTTDSIKNIRGGYYSCVVTDSYNCIIKTKVVIPDTGGPKAIITSQTNELCYGGNNGVAIASGFSGSPPYKYVWNDGSTNVFAVSLPAGPAVCTVTDTTGCAFSVAANITQPLQIQGNIQTIGVCYGVLSGGSATITVSGGTPPYSLSWSTGSTTDSIADVTPGSYFCTVTDSNKCQVNDTAHIRQASPLMIDSMVAQITSCFGCNNGSVTVNVTGGIPPGDSSYYYYIWSNGTIGSPVITNLDSGIYSVCVTSPYGCGTICDSTEVVTGIGAITNSKELKIYPVPGNGIVNIDFSAMAEEGLLTVSNVLGEAVYNANYLPNQNHLSLNLANLPDGLYFVKIINGKNMLQGKIIIQK